MPRNLILRGINILEFSIFFHLDYTIGTGITPVHVSPVLRSKTGGLADFNPPFLPKMYLSIEMARCASAQHPAQKEVPVCAVCATAGREFHPAPKISLKFTSKLRVVKGFMRGIISLMLPEEKLLKALEAKKRTLSIAESCTGGLLANRITNIPGSSKVFLLGIIAYANSAKCRLLKIPEKTIQSYGAVSSPTARLMAESARRLGGSDLGIGITGIAGPGGGSKNKPVGTVFIAVSSPGETIVRKFFFKGSRLRIKKQAADKAIEIILKSIQ